MDARAEGLIAEMKRNPRDEGTKLRYEEFLAGNRPDSVERRLLTLERELGRICADQAAFIRLVDQYIEFRAEHSSFFWDHRGGLDYLFRKFRVWLTSFNETRRFAVEQALQLTLHQSFDLDDLPVAIVSATAPDTARNTKDKIIEFIRRYKGPTGREPDVRPDEIVLVVTPSWIESIAGLTDLTRSVRSTIS